jgi:hypothetical protein
MYEISTNSERSEWRRRRRRYCFFYLFIAVGTKTYQTRYKIDS